MITADLKFLQLLLLKQRGDQPFHLQLIQPMILLDSFLLLLIIAALHFIKFKYPNFLFFCKGAVLFLPPEEQPKKQKKGKQGIQIKIMQLQYDGVKEYPMADEYERVIFLVVGLLLYIPIKYIICLLIDHINNKSNTISSSSFTYIVCLVIMIYLIKLGIQIFWISSYNLKYSFLITIGLNILLFMIYLTVNSLGGSDGELQWAIVDYRKLLTILFGKQIPDTVLNTKIVLILILVINVIFTLITIPAVIKFGNWYTKTLKEVYYEDGQSKKIADPQQRQERQKKQAILKQKSIKTIRFLNLYLVCVLIFLFFSHTYCYRFISSGIADLIRIILMAAIVYINCYTLSDAIEFNGSFAYKHISEYAATDDPEERKRLRQKTLPYLYYVWYHKFQFMFRVLVPVMLFAMLVDWKYMHEDNSGLRTQPIISHSHCGIQSNQLAILENLYKCQIDTPSSHIHQVSEPIINGVLVAGQRTLNSGDTQQRIAKYGVFNSYFMTQFLEQLLWYNQITVYAMTLLYILFLRKTVYDI